MSLHAHDGHDHGSQTGAAQAIPPAAMRGQRLEDSSVLLAKVAQFRLGIRTQLATLSEAGRRVALSGTVIADPQRRGVVGVSEDSILDAPPEGFPRLGETVAAGRILAYARPVLKSLERARRKAALADVEAQLIVNEETRKLMRQQLRGKVAMASVASALERLAGERRALRVRKVELLAGLDRRLPLKAPQAGVISSVHARIGALIGPGDAVFEIVDPEDLWVDVTRYDADPVVTERPVMAVTGHNVRLTLEWAGQDVRMRDGFLNVHFRVVAAGAPLHIGEPVNLHMESARRERGVRLPASSVGWAPGSGEHIWVQTQAERFMSRPVETVALGDGHVLVTAGVQPGERVVIAGAWLLAQVH